ncbi:Uncharacterised protein [Streptococcus pneumoniae]|nr:Uncharacterised protein [Streptococcus pneumoniae]
MALVMRWMVPTSDFKSKETEYWLLPEMVKDTISGKGSLGLLVAILSSNPLKVASVLTSLVSERL